WAAGAQAFFGTFQGRVHHFTGTDWKVLDFGASEQIRVLVGRAPDDVWFSAAADELFHFDGQGVERIALLEGEIRVNVSGIAPAGPGEALVATWQGHVLSCTRGRSARPLYIPRLGGEFGMTPLQLWRAMAYHRASIYLAGKDGLYRLEGGQPRLMSR